MDWGLNTDFIFRYTTASNGWKLAFRKQKMRQFEWIPVSTELPIVLYGTSIAQGACASRPAMAWGNIVQRSLDYPLINLGFSGNGKLAPEVIEFIKRNQRPAIYLGLLTQSDN